MCKCLAGNVACCCFSCALNVLISIISAFLVVFIIVGVLLYFYYKNEDDPNVSKLKDTVADNLPDSVKSGWSDITNSVKDTITDGVNKIKGSN